ncbi:MAG TPA: hypothetical protein VKG82_00165 [Solirubrobacteraceae bacterium]|nr:hypothetical protein [Solirubrobacteraceae bacterium]
MGPRPWKPARELDAALARGDLRYAISLAEQLRLERGRPIPLEVASRFLPLIAEQSPQEYDAYAVRWLARWVSEAGAPSITAAASVAAALAELPHEPSSLQALLGSSR